MINRTINKMVAISIIKIIILITRVIGFILCESNDPIFCSTDQIKKNHKRESLRMLQFESSIYCGKGNFFTDDYKSQCMTCPNGFECLEDDTLWPIICKEGFFANNTTTCSSCPEGTFNFEKGSRHSSDCIPCPAGKNCSNKNINFPELIKECESGFVCETGTGLVDIHPCPSGYFCPPNTTPDTKYDNKCPAGFICGEGTKEEEKENIKCFLNYYCPYGSKFYTNLIDQSNYCPFGTFTFQIGSTNLLECIPEKIYNFFPLGQDSNIVSNTKSKFIRKLKSSDNVVPVINEVSLNKYYDLRSEANIVGAWVNNLLKTQKNDLNYNRNRQPIMSLSPIIKDIGYQPSQTKTIFVKYNNFPIDFHFYNIEKNSYALVTMDLRHLSIPFDKFSYALDWDITIEKYYSIKDNNFSLIEMPEIFINSTNIKSKVHEFSIYTLEDIFIKISVNIYNGLALTYSNLFLNTTTIQVAKPNRAIIGTSNFFAVILKKSSEVNYPINLPYLNYLVELRGKAMSDKIIKNFISYPSTDLTIKNKKVEGINSFPQPTFYWGKNEMMGMPYLPYFSNCKGYGKYIPLWGLFEQNSNCKLVDKEDTVYASNFSFGKTPKADKCDVELECIYDDEIDVKNPYWYNLKQGDYLFSITEKSITIDNLFNEFDGNDLTEVSVTLSTLPPNTIPGSVILNFHFYQKSEIEKRIVAVELKYMDPIKIEDIENKYIVPYKLKITFSPYSHTKLMVSFSLSSNFYILLYLIQGLIDIILVSVFFFFHKCASRIKPIPNFKFFSFIPLMIPSTIYGFILAIIPISLVLFIITASISGKLTTSCDDSSISTSSCYISLFDYIPYIAKDDLDSKTLRMSRVGTAFFAMGIYLLLRSSKIMIPEEPTYYKSSFDRNSWNIFNWKHYNFIFINFFIFCIFVYFTFLSFSFVWGQNFWIFIHIFKIIGIVLEVYLKSTIQDQILIAGIPCVFNIIQGLLTFGASDYIDFLNSSFVELVSVSVERLYLEPLILFLQENWKYYYTKFVDYIRKLLKLDLEIEENKIQEFGNGDNEPIFIENGLEMMSENDVLNIKKETPIKIKEAKSKSSFDNHFDSVSNLLDFVRFDQSTVKSASKVGEASNYTDAESSRIKFLDEKLKNNGKAKKNIEIKVEKLYDKYKIFSADLLSLFFNIIFYLFIWIYYDETQIFRLYSIQQSNFIYFYYFVLISPIFYITSDILFHNMLAYYYGTKIHEFLDYLKYRFKVRRTSWALDDDKINTKLEPEFRKLDKLCFSSQYYFILTLYCSGMCFALIGITTIILNGLNLFGDIATPLIVCYIFIVCFFIEKFCLWIGKVLGVWHVYSEKSDSEKNKLKLSETVKKISKTKILGKLQIPPKVCKIKNWEIIKYIKDQQEIIEENIKTERMLQEHVRRQFLNENRTWLRQNIGTILSPRTLYLNKEKVIDAMKSRFKLNKAEHDLFANSQTHHNEGFQSKISEKFQEDCNQFNTSECDSEKNLNENSKKIIINNLSKETKIGMLSDSYVKRNKVGKILKIWIVRSKSSVELFNLVRLSIHHSRKGKCDLCGSKFLLRAICVTPILKIFDKFLNETGSIFDNYDSVYFKKYFMENAKIITLCPDCQK